MLKPTNEMAAIGVYLCVAYLRNSCCDGYQHDCVGSPRRSFSPALALSVLSPKLSWSEDETKAGVQRGFTVTRPDGSGFTPYDLKRLQARLCTTRHRLRSHHAPGMPAGLWSLVHGVR
jgi:hypothetical protein